MSADDAHGTNQRSRRITRWVVLTALGVWSSYTLVVFGALVYPIEGAYDAPQTGFVALYLAAGLIGAVGLALATARRRFGSGHADDA